MPPDRLPQSVLAALGLVVAPSCGLVKPCLDYAVEQTGDTGDSPTTTTYGPCLDYAPCLTAPVESATTGDTGTPPGGGSATDTLGGSGAASRSAVFERLEVEGVLPADVLERLKQR